MTKISPADRRRCTIQNRTRCFTIVMIIFNTSSGLKEVFTAEVGHYWELLAIDTFFHNYRNNIAFPEGVIFTERSPDDYERDRKFCKLSLSRTKLTPAQIKQQSDELYPRPQKHFDCLWDFFDFINYDHLSKKFK